MHRYKYFLVYVGIEVCEMNNTQRNTIEGYKQGLIDLIVLMNDRTQENMDQAMQTANQLIRRNPEGASVSRVADDEVLHKIIEQQIDGLMARIEDQIVEECKKAAWEIYEGPRTLTPEEEDEVKRLEDAEFYHLMDDASNTMHESWVKAGECRKRINEIKGAYDSRKVKV